MSRLIELLARQLARPPIVTYGGAHAAQIDPELLEELRKADDAAAEQELQLHNLQIENARLRQGRNKGGRAVETATEAYVVFGMNLLKVGVLRGNIESALAETFLETDNTRPGRAVAKVMTEIDLRRKYPPKS
jgi:hypothetical protein